jgi:hypothetical protein
MTTKSLTVLGVFVVACASTAGVGACGGEPAGGDLFRPATGGGAGPSAGGTSSSGPSSGGSSNGGSTGVGGNAGTSGPGGAFPTDAGLPDANCQDLDNDGQTTCAGDCDDSDRNNFSTNIEFCGDNRDNNCNSMADENCQGLGTFVSSTIGKPTNPGTQAAPVNTIAAGIQNAKTIGGKQIVFIGEGHYTEKVTVEEGVSLSGGYQCSQTSCTWALDPKMYDSAVLATDEQGMIVGASVTRATMIRGLRIMGQDGAGVGRGRTSMTINGGTPILANDRFFGPTVSSGIGIAARSVAIIVNAPSNDPRGVLLTGNEINGGTSIDTVIGLAAEWAAVRPPSPAEVFVHTNVFKGGNGRSVESIALWSTGPGTRIEENQITTGDADGGHAFGVVGGSQFVINRNRINTSGAGSCQNTIEYCGGIRSASSTSTITNNIIAGVMADRSVGVHLLEAEVPAGKVILNGNTIDAGGGGSMSAAVVVQIGICGTCGFNGSVGSIRNNIFLGGTSAARFGVYEDAPVGKQQHPQALENNLFFISSPKASDHLYRLYDGSTATFLNSIMQVNNLKGSVPPMIVGNNVTGDPVLDMTFHLTSGSPAIDRGTSTEAPVDDLDGQSRPLGIGIDIGADETK